MSAHDLIYIFTEQQITHLRPSVNAIDLLGSQRVPETDCSVSGTTSWGEKPVLMGRPADCFDSGSMALEFYDRVGGVEVPDVELVVIATGG